METTMAERLKTIRDRYLSDPALRAAYERAIARIDAAGLTDHKASLLPDPLTATVAEYEALATAPTRELLHRIREDLRAVEEG